MFDVMIGIIFGIFLCILGGVPSSVERDVTKSKALCEKPLPRNQSCVMVFIPDVTDINKGEEE